MKLSSAGIAALSLAKAYAHICQDSCGDYCSADGRPEDAGLSNTDLGGFLSDQDCEEHPCSLSWAEGQLSDAQWHECEEGARELEERKYNKIVKMAKALMTTNYSLREIHKRLQNYGCHCFPGQTRAAGGHGPVVDDKDALCRDLARCHRCIDMENADGVVDVDDDKYRFDVVNGTISCDKNREKGAHQSKIDLCECDAKFASDLAAIWNDDDFNENFWLTPKHMKLIEKGKMADTKFDIHGVCVGMQGGRSDACCGAYPERFPYNSDSRGCCNGQATFNTMSEECCANGQVASLGTC